MSESLLPEEVAIAIRARQILKSKGIAADTDVAGLCKAAGVSRKTGYQWTEKYLDSQKDHREEFGAKLEKLQSDYDKLKNEHYRLDFENRGRKLAWEIHRVDELLAGKKNTTGSKKEKRQ
jgi:hypothetical protein